MNVKNFYAVSDTNEKIFPEVKKINGGFSFRIKKSAVCKAKTLRLFEAATAKRTGDEGFYLFPGGTNQPFSSIIYFTEKPDGQIYPDNVNPHENLNPLNVYAVLGFDGAFYFTVEPTSEYKPQCSVKNGDYKFYIELNLVKNPLFSDIKFTVYPVPKSFSAADVACAYRQKLIEGGVKTLKQRCKKNKGLDYFIKNPYIRIRMAWKKTPNGIIDQNPDNEPPLFVACDFKRVIKIMDELHAQKVDGATIQLVGFNYKGHDGRWPQMLPVEPMLGGEEGLKEVMRAAKKYGYKIACHTNTIDSYKIADCFNENAVAKNADGSLKTGQCWSAGQAYLVCPIKQYETIKRQAKSAEKLGFSGVYYVDVNSTVSPVTCYDKKHLCSVEKSIKINRKIMRFVKKRFDGFSSEGGVIHYVKDLDFSLYNVWGEPDARMSDLADDVIPLQEMIEHGFISYGSCNNAWNYTVREPIFRPHLYLVGAKPVIYLNRKFFNVFGDNRSRDDLTTFDDTDIKRSVSEIVKTQKEYEKLANLQFEFIVDFKRLDSGVMVSAFSGGTKIAANLTDKPLTYHGKPLAAYDYIVDD